VVATPIGNLEDITHRALRILSSVHLIACEDTRHTHRLLAHYGIQTPTISYHEHNERERTEELIAKLAAGADIALVSDAGTPLISDPGYRVVSRAAAEGIPVVPIPGAAALLTALAASGLPTDSFYFGGFLPAKTGQRRRILQSLIGLECTLVFYEAPHRIIESLEDVAAVLGDRPVVLTRELTKLHEEFIRGTAAGVLNEMKSRPAIKGELTLLIGKTAALPAPEMALHDAYEQLLNRGIPRMEAIKQIARERGLSKRQVYAALEGTPD
jgi:16S rRNA (cytidine1402-2'-O)-methyltransferase